MNPIPLQEAKERPAFGSKLVDLGSAARAGLPVPPAFALSHEGVAEVMHRRGTVLLALRQTVEQLGFPLAVRHSPIGRFPATAKVVAQPRAHLATRSYNEVVVALEDLWASAQSGPAVAERRRLGLPSHLAYGIILQPLISSDRGGSMRFEGDETVIEAAWGLPGSVAPGVTNPDVYRLSVSGEVVTRSIGNKDKAVRPQPMEGDVEEVEIGLMQAVKPTLDDRRLAALADLAEKARGLGGTFCEWAFVDDKLWLLTFREGSA